MGKRGPSKGTGGRPRKLILDAATVTKVEAYATCGLTQEEIALLLGIAPSTFCENKAYSEKLSEAIKVGQAKAHAHVASKLVSQINAGSVPATIFYLKARCKWNDRPDLKEAVEEIKAIMPGLAIKIEEPKPKDAA